MSSLTRSIRRKSRKPEPKSRKAIEWLRARDAKEAEEWEHRIRRRNTGVRKTYPVDRRGFL